ncbi:hypothetical protein P4O66_004194 [Electrophorus voltai]|uniref:Uncharacterized protein n=1 Tax=Electrophorus voltai TaxID=2609070 RepID=A0AAD8ZPC6_9TELE|nr:hypothetical protein P4O66_004194 [Electrophorus voltai]
MVRGRTYNMSFRQAIDKSYDGPSEPEDDYSDDSSGRDTPASGSSRQELEDGAKEKKRTRKKKEKKTKAKKKEDAEDPEKRTKKKGFTLLRGIPQGMEKLHTWVQMCFKPEKSRSLLLKKGKVTHHYRFYLGGTNIPSVMEKPFKRLRKTSEGILKDAASITAQTRSSRHGQRRVDLGKQLRFPENFMETIVRPAIELVLETSKQVAMLEFTVAWVQSLCKSYGLLGITGAHKKVASRAILEEVEKTCRCMLLGQKLGSDHSQSVEDDDFDPNYARINAFREPAASSPSLHHTLPLPAAHSAPAPSEDDLEGLYAKVNKLKPAPQPVTDSVPFCFAGFPEVVMERRTIVILPICGWCTHCSEPCSAVPLTCASHLCPVPCATHLCLSPVPCASHLCPVPCATHLCLSPVPCASHLCPVPCATHLCLSPVPCASHLCPVPLTCASHLCPVPLTCALCHSPVPCATHLCLSPMPCASHLCPVPCATHLCLSPVPCATHLCLSPVSCASHLCHSPVPLTCCSTEARLQQIRNQFQHLKPVPPYAESGITPRVHEYDPSRWEICGQRPSHHHTRPLDKYPPSAANEKRREEYVALIDVYAGNYIRGISEPGCHSFWDSPVVTYEPINPANGLLVESFEGESLGRRSEREPRLVSVESRRAPMAGSGPAQTSSRIQNLHKNSACRSEAACHRWREVACPTAQPEVPELVQHRHSVTVVQRQACFSIAVSSLQHMGSRLRGGWFPGHDQPPTSPMP